MHPQRFCIVGVPASEQSTVVSLGAWGAAVQTGDRVTYVLPEADWQRVAARFPHARASAGWRMVSLEAHLPLEAYGVLALLAGALAERGIPCLALGSFDTDHLLVPEERLGGALQGLEAALEAAREGVPEP